MLRAGGTLGRKPVWRREERASRRRKTLRLFPGPASPPAGIGTSSGLLPLGSEPPSRRLQALARPRKASSPGCRAAPGPGQAQCPRRKVLCGECTSSEAASLRGYKPGATRSDGRAHLSQSWGLDGSAWWLVSWPPLSVPSSSPSPESSYPYTLGTLLVGRACSASAVCT